MTRQSRRGDLSTIRHALHKEEGWELIIGETVMDICPDCLKIVERKMREQIEH